MSWNAIPQMLDYGFLLLVTTYRSAGLLFDVFEYLQWLLSIDSQHLPTRASVEGPVCLRHEVHEKLFGKDPAGIYDSGPVPISKLSFK